MEKINLCEIIARHTEIEAKLTYQYDITKEVAIDFGKQLLQLAAENANMNKDYDYGRFDENNASFNKGTCKLFYTETSGHGDCGYEAVKINKQSILDTIKQVE